MEGWYLYGQRLETRQENFAYFIYTDNPKDAARQVGIDKSISDIVYFCDMLNIKNGVQEKSKTNLFEVSIKRRAYNSLEYLTKNVKKINTRFKVDTPLTFAIKQKDLKACSILLEHGDTFLQLKTPDLENKLPLDIAKAVDSVEIIELLEAKYSLMLEFLVGAERHVVEVKDEPVEEGEIACSICFENRLKVSFECGHCSCSACSKKMKDCWACKKPIKDVRPIFLN